MWRGAGAVGVDDRGKVLLQGRENKWGLPGGGFEVGESPEQCCEREVWEETEYRVVVGRRLCLKRGSPIIPESFELHIFEATVIGGSPNPQDPDGEAQHVGWFDINEMERLTFAFEEDKDLVMRYLRGEAELPLSPWFE